MVFIPPKKYCIGFGLRTNQKSPFLLLGNREPGNGLCTFAVLLHLLAIIFDIFNRKPLVPQNKFTIKSIIITGQVTNDVSRAFNDGRMNNERHYMRYKFGRVTKDEKAQIR